MSNNLKSQKGITLVALVVTIIVLLIVAGIAIHFSIGDGGLINRAQNSADKWNKAYGDEQSELAGLADRFREKRNRINSGGSNNDDSGNHGATGGNNIGGDDEDDGNQETEPTHKPSTTTPSSSVSFATDIGKIDIIWLNTKNRIIDKPNSPADHLGGMTPVKWNGTTEATTTASDSEWYSYTSIDGDGDNTTSHWANAINSGSYFVWIPRYAYRITYYDGTSSQPTGYYDGCGMWKSTGELKLSLEDGIETVVKDGWSYIVHPAFIDDSANEFSNGGWDSDLAGIWVAKYEMSMETNGVNTVTTSTTGAADISDKIKAVSKPSYTSWRYINISKMYSNSLNYDRNKESHLMKNSEWGAVAYLTHSQYGRNGHEIDLNNSSNMTGNGGGGTDLTGTSGIVNAYNSEVGQKASSTGNIYGIYDLSGGAEECVAAYNNKPNTDNRNPHIHLDAGENAGTKYATLYSNSSSTTAGTDYYAVLKTGDAMKEVYTQKSATVQSSAQGRNWFTDSADIFTSYHPFISRGGRSRNTLSSGIFCVARYGNSASSTTSGADNTFRVVMAI